MLLVQPLRPHLVLAKAGASGQAVVPSSAAMVMIQPLPCSAIGGANLRVSRSGAE